MSRSLIRRLTAFALSLAGVAVFLALGLPLPWLLEYVRETDDSKAGTMVRAPFSGGMFAYASLFVLLPLFYFGVPMIYQATLCAALVVLVLALYYRKRIGGYSGDCLGATQQVAEVTIYLAMLASWNSV